MLTANPFGLEDADHGKVAVFAIIVQAIADDEFVLDIETRIGRFNGHGTINLFGKQHAGAQTERRTFVAKSAQNRVESSPGIEDVIHHQDMTTIEVGQAILVKSHGAAALGTAVVTGDADGLQFHGQMNLPNQVGHEDRPALKNGHYRERKPFEVGRDCCAHLGNARKEGLRVDENTVEVIVEILWPEILVGFGRHDAGLKSRPFHPPKPGVCP